MSVSFQSSYSKLYITRSFIDSEFEMIRSTRKKFKNKIFNNNMQCR